MKLLQLEQTPAYVRDNEHVKNGYRPEMSARRACFSVFALHNETLNIWSHGITSIIFMFCLIDFNTLLSGSGQPKWPMNIFICSAIALFAASSIFHTMLCVSESIYTLFRKIDMACISLLMFSMFLPFCVYCFSASTAAAYIAGAFLVSSVCCVTSMMPVFHTNAFHIYRPMVFGCIGILGLAAIAYAGLTFAVAEGALELIAGQLGACFVGAVFYASKWPERCWQQAISPSMLIKSHVLFHICIAYGIWLYYRAMLLLFNQQN